MPTSEGGAAHVLRIGVHHDPLYRGWFVLVTIGGIRFTREVEDELDARRVAAEVQGSLQLAFENAGLDFFRREPGGGPGEEEA